MSKPPEKVDVGILTVIPAELAAVSRVFGDDLAPDFWKSDSGTNYRHGEVDAAAAGRRYRLAIGCIGSAGNYDAAAATTDLIHDVEPSCVLLCGIAAGFEDKTKIGEVIASERVVAYESGAIRETEGQAVLEPRPGGDRSSHGLMQDLAFLETSPARLRTMFDQIGATFPNPEGKEQEQWYVDHVAEQLTWRVQAVASGEKLLRDPSILKWVARSLHGRTQVGEMEAAGMATACVRHGIPWLVFRGISDFGDPDKTDDFHEFAAAAAASVLHEFVCRGIALNDRASMVEGSRQVRLPRVDESTTVRMLTTRYFAEPHSSTIEQAIQDQIPIVAFLSAAPVPTAGGVRQRYHLGHGYFGSLLRALREVHGQVDLLIVPSTAYLRGANRAFNRTCYEIMGSWLRATDDVVLAKIVTGFIQSQQIDGSYAELREWLSATSLRLERTLGEAEVRDLRDWRAGATAAQETTARLRRLLGQDKVTDISDDEVLSLSFVLRHQPSWFEPEWFVRVLKGLSTRQLSRRLLASDEMVIMEASKNRVVWEALSFCRKFLGIDYFPAAALFHTLPNLQLNGMMRSKESTGVLPLWGDISDRGNAASAEFAQFATAMFGVESTGDAQRDLMHLLSFWQAHLEQSSR